MADGESKAVSLLFRIAALVLSVAAAALMGTASQLVIVDGDQGPFSYAVSYSHYNALTYFVAAGAISAVCSAAALYLCAVRAAAAAAIGPLPLVPLLDAATQALLFSAAGAAFAARGVVGSAAGPWGSSAGEGGGGSVCDAAGAFCGKVSVAAAVGAFAAVAVAVASLARDTRRGSSSGGSCCDWPHLPSSPLLGFLRTEPFSELTAFREQPPHFFVFLVALSPLAELQNTWAFQACCGAVESMMKLHNANLSPPQDCKWDLSVDDLKNKYETSVGKKLRQKQNPDQGDICFVFYE
ncbi:hypothetical protein BAE44_0021017 [Dichanthelium oligosanthes]|uniref:CASP-like protein n=1 Tax=Dichanthelium oligosanthes TaxID=888268 RepID=A0A1E5UYH9_9POAL|nr:hypothetical protein BAE44_0021017 [Dichanthelium oligosanthes]